MGNNDNGAKQMKALIEKIEEKRDWQKRDVTSFKAKGRVEAYDTCIALIEKHQVTAEQLFNLHLNTFESNPHLRSQWKDISKFSQGLWETMASELNGETE